METKPIKFTAKDQLELDFKDDTSNRMHTCPYREDVHGDYTTLCDCDEERTSECAWDV